MSNTTVELGKDNKGEPLAEGDIITFGERQTKAKVIGLHEDGRLMAEEKITEKTYHGIREWRYVWIVPASQTYKN